MQEINNEVVRRLKAQRNHKEVLALWKELWSHYKEDGANGVEEFVENLLEEPDEEA